MRDLVHEHSGLYYNQTPAGRPRGSARPVGRRTPLQLVSRLFLLAQVRPASETEWPRLTDALSVQETYFWREFDQIRACCRRPRPAARGAPAGPVRVWSAACAPGRGAADHRHRARRRPGGSTESSVEHPAPATSARAARLGRTRGVPRAVVPGPAAAPAGEVLHARRTAAGGWHPAIACGAYPAPGEPAGAVTTRPSGRHGPVRLLPERVHLLLARRRSPGGPPVRRPHARARATCSCGVRVAAAGRRPRSSWKRSAGRSCT